MALWGKHASENLTNRLEIPINASDTKIIYFQKKLVNERINEESIMIFQHTFTMFSLQPIAKEWTDMKLGNPKGKDFCKCAIAIHISVWNNEKISFFSPALCILPSSFPLESLSQSKAHLNTYGHAKNFIEVIKINRTNLLSFQER